MRYGRSNRDPFGFEEKGKIPFRKFICVIACVLIVLVVLWFMISNESTDNNQNNLEAELSNLINTVSRQQNQISSLQELTKQNKEGLDSTKPQLEQLNLSLLEINLAESVKQGDSGEIFEIERLIQAYKERVDEIEETLHIEVKALNLMINENMDDILEFSDEIDKIKKQIEKLNEERKSIYELINEKQEYLVSAKEIESNSIEINEDHIYVVIVDVGAFLDMYERRRSKIAACGINSIGLGSVEKVYATIDALYDIEEKGTSRSFTVLLSTTEIRSHYFDDLEGIEIVVSGTYF